MRLELEQTATAFAPIEKQMVFASVNSGNTDFDKILADGIAAAQAGNRAQARILLQFAVEIDKQSEAGWLWLASISEYPEELLVFLDRVLAINPKNARASEWKTATNQLMAKTFVQRGIDASKDGRNDLAMECFDRALGFDEQNQVAWFWKDSLSKEPVVEYSLNDCDRAEETVNVQPSVDTILIEAEASLSDGNRTQALELVDEAIGVEPDSEKAWSLRSHLVDDFDEKRSSLERVVEINPENETARAALETLYAMIETVPPNSEENREPASERLLNTPFDQVAAPIVQEHENSPTQELELPQAILDHNPFVSDEVQNVSGEASAPEEIFVDASDHEGSLEHAVVPSHVYEAPAAFDAANAAPAEEPEIAPVQQFDNYRTDENEPTWSESYAEPVNDQVVQEVSAATYLEGPGPSPELPPVDPSYLTGSSWSEDNDDVDTDVIPADVDAPATWVIDDSMDVSADEAEMESGKTILVVDDSPVVRKLIAGKLEESGYRVIAAGSGAEAMAVISNATPDLVLLDIAMPKMDGYQVCENIRKNGPTRNVPVVLISGKDGYFDEDRAQLAGTSSFISKPFGPETLMRALETYLPAA